jgi:hypothetical protein
MRDLTVDERSLVAGAGRRGISTDGWGEPLPEVVVIDKRPVYDPSWFVADLGGDFGGGGGEDSGDEDTPPDKEEPKDPKCVGSQPSGVSLSDMHKAAINLKAAELAAGNSFYENAALLYRIPGSSEIKFTYPIHTESESGVDSLRDAVKQLPDKAIIVGIYHSQPPREGVASKVMSSGDWGAWGFIFNSPENPMYRDGKNAILPAMMGRGITADPNGLSYILDKSTGKIHVYDRTDQGSDKPQCAINGTGG